MRTIYRHCGTVCIVFLLSLALVVSALTLPKAHAGSSTQVYLPLVTGASSPEAQVLALTNQQRRLNGCKVDLTMSAQLTAAAYAHSRDMALNDYFSHTGSDQSTMITRIASTGYNYSMIAENIAAGSSNATPQQVVSAWMNSPGHRANILNCNLHEIGVGYYYQADDQPNVDTGDPSVVGPFFYYWTEDFGTQMN
jgi:uncharacterized protein YkwD